MTGSESQDFNSGQDSDEHETKSKSVMNAATAVAPRFAGSPRGLAVPGMPAGSPGMDEPPEGCAVILFADGQESVYARY